WKQVRSLDLPGGNSRPLQCVVSGRPIADAVLFPLIKKVPGGTSSGVSLVSFNNSAFESYGLSRNANAPVSREAAEKAATALNRLIDRAYPDPRNPEQSLPARSLKISADTIACYWSASAEREAQDALDA